MISAATVAFYGNMLAISAIGGTVNNNLLVRPLDATSQWQDMSGSGIVQISGSADGKELWVMNGAHILYRSRQPAKGFEPEQESSTARNVLDVFVTNRLYIVRSDGKPCVKNFQGFQTSEWECAQSVVNAIQIAVSSQKVYIVQDNGQVSSASLPLVASSRFVPIGSPYEKPVQLGIESDGLSPFLIDVDGVPKDVLAQEDSQTLTRESKGGNPTPPPAPGPKPTVKPPGSPGNPGEPGKPGDPNNLQPTLPPADPTKPTNQVVPLPGESGVPDGNPTVTPGDISLPNSNPSNSPGGPGTLEGAGLPGPRNATDTTTPDSSNKTRIIIASVSASAGILAIAVIVMAIFLVRRRRRARRPIWPKGDSEYSRSRSMSTFQQSFSQPAFQIPSPAVTASTSGFDAYVKQTLEYDEPSSPQPIVPDLGDDKQVSSYSPEIFYGSNRKPKWVPPEPSAELKNLQNPSPVSSASLKS
ncbi:hypothetical protein HDU97_004506 [Phlyctochytrium planicorne]|nr:hypothetical protein HDU97_004506 [Phlyctochytrium planicorne]